MISQVARSAGTLFNDVAPLPNTRPLIWQGAPDSGIADRVATAVETLLQADLHLFIVDANERSITHRLAVHLGTQFSEWDIDCEYNRKGDVRKLLSVVPLTRADPSDDTEGSSVFPDVIVHRRGQPLNLLVIEVKKQGASRRREADLLKLGELRKQYGYGHALFLCFACTPTDPGLVEALWLGER